MCNGCVGREGLCKLRVGRGGPGTRQLQRRLGAGAAPGDCGRPTTCCRGLRRGRDSLADAVAVAAGPAESKPLDQIGVRGHLVGAEGVEDGCSRGLEWVEVVRDEGFNGGGGGGRWLPRRGGRHICRLKNRWNWLRRQDSIAPIHPRVAYW